MEIVKMCQKQRETSSNDDDILLIKLVKWMLEKDRADKF